MPEEDEDPGHAANVGARADAAVVEWANTVAVVRIAVHVVAGRALVAGGLLALAAGCSDDGDDQPDAAPNDTGCPVAPGVVSEALGYPVVVDDRSATETSCRFEPAGAAGTHPGAHVLVVERVLATGPDDEDGYDAVLAGVESEVGPADLFEDDEVEGADRGWVATLGRVVQVAAADGERLVQVTVVDGELEASAARSIALALAEQAL